MTNSSSTAGSTRRTILLTGATGYLGSRLLRALLKEDKNNIVILKRSFSNTFRIQDLLDKVRAYDADATNIEDIFRHNKIDTILHCATDYGRKNTSMLHVIEANLLLPVKLLELGNNYGVTCFINTDTILDKRINHYSLSKKQFRDWLLSYKNKMICINVSLEHFYGPGDDKTKFASFIIGSLLKKIDKIDLTAGEQKRDFIYIDDIQNAFMKIIQHSQSLDNDFYDFEIGSNQVISIKEFVQMIKRLTGNTETELNFGALPYRENETMECSTNLEAIKKLGWSAGYSLEDGLKLTIQEELNHL